MNIAIIVGSTRPGRQTATLASWVAAHARSAEDFEVQVLDLADFELPFFNEPISPRYNPGRETSGIVKDWLDALQAADGYIVVTPEYNHSIPGVLKNAFDYPDWQVQRKPMAIVSHGVSGGARAAEHLKGIISEMQAVVIPPAVAFAMKPSDVINEHGVLAASVAEQPYGPQSALDNLLAELKWYTATLANARTAS